jgi:hypothetical protein
VREPETRALERAPHYDVQFPGRNVRVQSACHSAAHRIACRGRRLVFTHREKQWGPNTHGSFEAAARRVFRNYCKVLETHAILTVAITRKVGCAWKCGRLSRNTCQTLTSSRVARGRRLLLAILSERCEWFSGNANFFVLKQ